MKIDDCYKCGDSVTECTGWHISIAEGFLCEKCNIKKQLTDEEYHANAAWLKSLKMEENNV